MTIKDNSFYKVFYDTPDDDAARKEALVKLIDGPGHAEYEAFKGFLRGVARLVYDNIDKAKETEFQMVQGLAARPVDGEAVAGKSIGQASFLDANLATGKRMTAIASLLLEAEQASKKYGAGFTDTFGIYMDFDVQARTFRDLVTSNGNTQEELRQFGFGALLQSLLPQKPPVQLHDFGQASKHINAPSAASFRRRPKPG